MTRALGCEIPHWWHGREQTANLTFDWLAQQGHNYGWTHCTAEEASAHAATGACAVAVWKNPSGGPGHIAIVMPVPPGEDGTWIAQAGAHNYSTAHVTSGFGKLQPTYYAHA